MPTARTPSAEKNPSIFSLQTALQSTRRNESSPPRPATHRLPRSQTRPPSHSPPKTRSPEPRAPAAPAASTSRSPRGRGRHRAPSRRPRDLRVKNGSFSDESHAPRVLGTISRLSGVSRCLARGGVSDRRALGRSAGHITSLGPVYPESRSPRRTHRCANAPQFTGTPMCFRKWRPPPWLLPQLLL